MMVVIYASVYGSAKRYAIELSKKLKCEVIDYKEVKNIEKYSQFIYVGGLYAGGTLGLKDFLKKNAFDFKKQKLIIATVGLADSSIEENIMNIKEALKKIILIENYNDIQVFHLRGCIDYTKLSLKHKIMMKALYSKIKKIPKEQRTSENNEFIETYNKKIDFVDFESLNDIVSYIQNK